MASNETHDGTRPPVAYSNIELNYWPGISRSSSAVLMSLLYQFQQSQWYTPSQLLDLQFGQLQLLLDHAYRTVPFYRQRLEAAGIVPGQPLDMECWQRVPILKRSDLQGQDLKSQQIPQSHGRVENTQTSGSTGEPVRLALSELTQIYWRAFTLRDHEWHRRDYSGRLASIRPIPAAVKPVIQSNWGAPVASIYKTGETGVLNIGADISRQMDWLVDFNPDYLLTFPSNLQALIDYSREHDLRLDRLREVRCISETVTDRVRSDCSEYWGVPLSSTYSSQEAGYIAIQCPDAPCLHVQSENVLVEILDDNDSPCREGEVGRVVISVLHNFATPLLRYELRDLAEAGASCPCGRGLPVINRVIGRERNMLRLPDGGRRWPLTGYQQYHIVTDAVRQFQFVQTSLEEIDVRLVVRSPLLPDTEQKLAKLIQDSLGYPFRIRFSYHDNLPRTASGKFEEFISQLS